MKNVSLCYKRDGQCLACVHPIRDALGLVEHQQNGNRNRMNQQFFHTFKEGVPIRSKKIYETGLKDYVKRQKNKNFFGTTKIKTQFPYCDRNNSISLTTNFKRLPAEKLALICGKLC